LDPVSLKPTQDELNIKKILKDFSQREILSPLLDLKDSIEPKNELDPLDLVFGRKNVQVINTDFKEYRYVKL
jgi:hypothetical protein